MKVRIVVLVSMLAAILVSVLVFSLLTMYRNIHNTGNVKVIGVSVFWDTACTNETQNIDWGNIEPGTNKSFTVYTKNNGTITVLLDMITTNWQPTSTATYITLGWNCTGYNLNPGLIAAAILILVVSANISNVANFSFDILISGTEV